MCAKALNAVQARWPVGLALALNGIWIAAHGYWILMLA
jgi:hypothetical protein